MRKLGKIKINIKEPTPTAAERLHQAQQAIRKQKGLPDPSHYKQMAAQKQAEISSMKEDKQTELKPRNFVAKNAKTAGAGKHKDIKKMLKDIRGQKHKGKMEEEVEQLDEMPESSMKTRDVHAHLKSKGWSVARTSGGHDIYKHPKAKNVIAVPRHKQLKAPLIKGILKSSHVVEEVMDEQLVKQGRFQSGPVKKPFKSNTIVSAMKEAIKLGGTGGRGNIYQYDRNPPPKDGNELENVPFHAKTQPQKKLQNALNDLGKKMKETHPKLKEDIGGPITVVKKGTNIKTKISANSYDTFKHHGFRKEDKDSHEYDYEGEMVLNQLDTIMRHAEYLKDMIKPDTNLPEWVQAKITLATDYIQTSCDYLTSEMNEAANPAQQAAIAINMKKNGIKPKNEEVEQIDELSNKTLHSYVHKATPQSHLRTKGINKALTKSMYKAMAPKPKNVKEDVDPSLKTESATDPSESELKGNKMSRKAQIVKSAAKKGTNQGNPDKFIPNPELSSEINKTP